MIRRCFQHQMLSGPLLWEDHLLSYWETNINSNPAINQIWIFSSAHFPGNGCNNNVIRLCLVTINALDSVHVNDLALYPVRFTTKRREILLTYLMLCRLREETKVCDRCSLHIQCFQTLSKWILLARYNTMAANNVNKPKLCGCNFHISRQLSFWAKKEDNALQLNLTGVKNVISIWILFCVPANLPFCQKKTNLISFSLFSLWNHSLIIIFIN